MQYGSNISSYNNIQYHTAADMLPFGITAKVAYVPNLSSSAGDSTKTSGAIETNAVGSDAIMYRVDASPLDGLSIGASYFNASPTVGARYDQESGGAYAKYVMGPITVGYGREGATPIVAKGSEVTYYETDSYGIQFAVNEALSVSYGVEKSTKSTRTAVAAGATAYDQQNKRYFCWGFNANNSKRLYVMDIDDSTSNDFNLTSVQPIEIEYDLQYDKLYGLWSVSYTHLTLPTILLV